MAVSMTGNRSLLSLLVLVLTLLAGCATSMPRKDDPWEHFNRKMFGFNQTMDKIAIRPAAKTYRKLTTAGIRRIVSDFFANLRMPVTIVNDVLQAKPKEALVSTGRFLVNTTVGVLGLFDPASKMGLEYDPEDFGITLAKWGVPEGPYLVLPLIGPTTVRDVVRYPADGAIDPLSRYGREQHDYWPTLVFLVSLRARRLDTDSLLDTAYDPYLFARDAYRQYRLYDVYDGHPPMEMLQYLQGSDDVDPEQLLDEQKKTPN